MRNILAIIPARSGSKGVKDKNIRILDGKPLLWYSVQAAQECPYIHTTLVSTDSERYAEVARECGAEVPWLRPAELSADTTASIDVVIHALEYYLQQGKHFDAVCLLQPTTPLRQKGSLIGAVERFLTLDADALVSVVPVPHEYNPHWLFEPDAQGLLHIATGEKEIIKRRQELPPAFMRDGSIYLTKTSVLLEQRSLYGQKLTYWENNMDFRVNIDVEADWALAEEKVISLKGRFIGS
ncbi:MAG: acylneuraminate cytidylyltransferase family protein [Bacteroidetes bacterium]|nr:acylneuraminate cytidylyltransferase family protein [Bacteroidota bacterium]